LDVWKKKQQYLLGNILYRSWAFLVWEENELVFIGTNYDVLAACGRYNRYLDYWSNIDKKKKLLMESEQKLTAV